MLATESLRHDASNRLGKELEVIGELIDIKSSNTDKPTACYKETPLIEDHSKDVPGSEEKAIE